MTYLETSKGNSAKLTRWALRLANYDFTVQYKQGKIHGNADGLTRARQQANPSELTIDLNPVALAAHIEEAIDSPEAAELLPVWDVHLPNAAVAIGPR